MFWGNSWTQIAEFFLNDNDNKNASYAKLSKIQYITAMHVAQACLRTNEIVLGR